MSHEMSHPSPDRPALPALPPEATWQRVLRPIVLGLSLGGVLSYALSLLPNVLATAALLLLLGLGLVWCVRELRWLRRMQHELVVMQIELEARRRSDD